GGSAGCPARARQSSWVTLDVKFPVWITYGPRARSPTVNKSCMHSPCRTFSQAAGHVGGYSELYPQSRPQAAHSACGVSAQPVHRAVHTSARRQSRLAEDCRRRSIEQTCNLASAVAGLAAVAGADWRARRSLWCYSYVLTQLNEDTGEVQRGERRGDRSSGPGVRADTTARPRGRAVRTGRHDAVQG